MNKLFRPLVKYWYLVLGLTLIASVLAGWEREQSFESRARLLFKLGDEFLQSGVGPDARTSGRIMLAEAMNTDVQILTSYDRYRKVVEELGAESFAPDGASPALAPTPEEAVESLRGGINVKSVENSAVIHLSYDHPDPARAQLVLNTLIEVYFREREKVLQTREDSVLESIRDETFEDYADTRESYERFLDGASLLDMESTLGILRVQLMELSAAARDTRRQLTQDRHRLAAIEAEIGRQPARKEIYSEPRANTALERARNRLVELRVEEKQLLGKYTATSRPVGRVRSEIAELQRIIRAEESSSDRAVQRTGNNPIRDGLEMQRAELTVSTAGAEAQLEMLATQEASLRAELLELERRYVEAEKLRDAFEVAETRFRDVDEQYLSHRITSDSLAARETNVRVIESPSLPRAAVGLPATTRYTFGAVIGFLAGWILAVWIEMLRTAERRGTGVPDRRREALESRSTEGLAPDLSAGREPRRAAGTLPVLAEFELIDGGAR